MKQTSKDRAELDAPPEARWYRARTNEFPGGETIQVIFEGLMGFCYNRDQNCEVGIVHGARKHYFTLDVYERRDGGRRISGETELIPIPGEPFAGDSEEFTLMVTNRAREVLFYMVDGDLDRCAPIDDVSPPPPHYSYDFRWLLDLHGPDFYRIGLTRQPFAFKPRIIINDGLFHTYKPTPFFFAREGEFDHVTREPLGHVAYCMAANIYLKDNDTAEFKTDRHRWVFGASKRYVININNACLERKKDGETKAVHCKHSVLSGDKTERNDFHFYAKTLNLQTREELVLKLDPKAVQPPPPKSDPELNALGKPLEIRSTQDAPCGGAGYGQSDTFKP